jgi:hypothetical protein
MEDAENARRMLGNPAVAGGTMGRVLAAYLVDYLPFETEAERVMESVRLVLAPGLLDGGQRADLWRQSARKQAYLVGFLKALPDDLPERGAPRVLAPDLDSGLGRLAGQGNPWAAALLRVCTGAGQAWLGTVDTVLAKPPNQEVVGAAFECLRDYFALLRAPGDQAPNLPIGGLGDEAQRFAGPQCPDPAAGECLALSPALAPEIAAMRLLSRLGDGVVRPALPDPTALGTLMRRKLAPVLDPIRGRIRTLRGEAVLRTT